MQRITIKALEQQVEQINSITGNPMEPYSTDGEGKFSANVGCYHISQAYGGVQLVRMAAGGGERCPLSQGHIPKRDLYNELNAFIAGLTAKE